MFRRYSFFIKFEFVPVVPSERQLLHIMRKDVLANRLRSRVDQDLWPGGRRTDSAPPRWCRVLAQQHGTPSRPETSCVSTATTSSWLDASRLAQRDLASKSTGAGLTDSSRTNALEEGNRIGLAHPRCDCEAVGTSCHKRVHGTRSLNGAYMIPWCEYTTPDSDI